MWVDFIAYYGRYRTDHPALIDPANGRTLTYGALDQAANQWAARLANRGVGPGDRVVFLAKNCLEHLILWIACSRLRAIFVPLNFRLASGEREQQLNLIEAKVCLSSEEQAGFITLEEAQTWSETPFPRVGVQPNDPLLMLFTSGSTGQPKGVLLHAEMLLWNAINTQTTWQLNENDASIIHTPFFHTGGYNVIGLPLLRLGGTLIVTDHFEPKSVMRMVDQYRLTFLFAVPTMFQMMADQPEFKAWHPTSLRVCVSGGAPCPNSLISQYRVKGIPLKQGYGLTEVGPNCFAMSDQEALSRPDTIGRPALHSQVQLIDDNNQPVGPNTIGECVMFGPHVCLGYFRNDGAFQASLRQGGFRTGDLMTVDEEGYYRVVGRKKDMFISGGENVYPGEVVAALLQHSSIHAAVVVAVPHPTWGEVGCAFIQGPKPLELAEIRDFLNPLLARYKHPHQVIHLAEFPLLANGKVDQHQLKIRALQEKQG